MRIFVSNLSYLPIFRILVSNFSFSASLRKNTRIISFFFVLRIFTSIISICVLLHRDFSQKFKMRKMLMSYTLSHSPFYQNLLISANFPPFYLTHVYFRTRRSITIPDISPPFYFTSFLSLQRPCMCFGATVLSYPLYSPRKALFKPNLPLCTLLF